MHYYYHHESDSIFKMHDALPDRVVSRDDLSTLTHEEYIELSIKLDTNHEDTLI